MSHPATHDREFRADRLADALTDLWADAARQQTEPALRVSRVVTHDDPRTPQEAEVRGFLQGAVRGALVKEPPAPKSLARRVLDFLTRWDDE